MSWQHGTMGKVVADHRRGHPTGVDWATAEDAMSAAGDCAPAGMAEGRTRSFGAGEMDAMGAMDGDSAVAPQVAACCYCRAAGLALEGARLARIGIGRLGRRRRALEAGRRWRRDWETADEVSVAGKGQLAWHRSSGLPDGRVISCQLT